MKKNDMKNLGLPLAVDFDRDLPAKKDASFDSWYVICNFEAGGKKLAFEWHQQSVKIAMLKLCTAEFLITDGSRDKCIHNALTEKASKKTGSNTDRLHVFSPWGSLEGDRKEMRLKLSVGSEAVDVVLKPTEQVLCNGTTGLLHFGTNDSYQYAFPNMEITGTLTVEGVPYEITGATAWFDRQWGLEMSKVETVGKLKGKFQQNWLWLGMTLNDEHTEAVSLWDTYVLRGRHCFATFVHADGSQNNAVANVEYEGVWTSQKSGNQYPKAVHIAVPQEQLELHLTSLITDPEFVREQTGICGCQILCDVTGSYKGAPIARSVVLELINNVCGGEAY